jgi:Tol biopolymer transport system component/predicted Ser/Thr protein kinase
MPLSVGDKLGPYEIIAPIGAGGMGEVFRARDPRLNRDVAIKVSAAQFSERFEREAKAIAALNHPNICQIYDVGPNYLVMEFIEGESPKGPMPLDGALRIARQIADALEAAHEKGIVHRDLKPGNIKIKPDGTVKVLDFGLAKVMIRRASPEGVENSPTLTLGMSETGMILGTAGYMSPEQARGQEVDKRADIWAFGVLLYELLTGKRAFAGGTVSDALAAVLAKDPDWTALPPGSPAETLRRCLEKDPRRRLRDIGDAVLDPEAHAPHQAIRLPLYRQRAVIGLALFAIVALAAALFLWNRSAPPADAVARLIIPLPPDQEVTGYPAISPDGRTIAYAAKSLMGEAQLYLRDLNSFEARLVAGSTGAWEPFFSPDGLWVAFFAHSALMKAAVAGGSPVKITDAPEAFGATWTEDGTIIFPSSFSSGLVRVSASGGPLESLTKPDGGQAGLGHILPHALPGGRNVLFTVLGGGAGGTALLSLDTHRWDMILPGRQGAAYAASMNGNSGNLFVSDINAELRSAPLDPSHPAPVNADNVVLTDVYHQDYDMHPWMAVSRTGTLVYAPGNPTKTSLVWVDRTGKTEPAFQDQALYSWVYLSPDGGKAAVTAGPDIWIHDFQRSTRSRLRSEGYSGDPIWTSDAKRIIFESDTSGDFDIYSQPADGSRPAEVLLKRPYNQFPDSLAPDGTLAFAESNPVTGEDIWLLSPDGKASPWLVRPFYDSNPRFSPDGRWLAYDSDESGRREVYVEAYPSRIKKVAISSGGGIVPIFSRDGKELFYCSPDSMMAVAIEPDGSFGTPRRLFDLSHYFIEFHTYDVSPDGKRFLMIRRDPGSVPRQLNVILNWFAELRKMTPGAKQ